MGSRQMVLRDQSILDLGGGQVYKTIPKTT